jgi:hypothetical protein
MLDLIKFSLLSTFQSKEKKIFNEKCNSDRDTKDIGERVKE